MELLCGRSCDKGVVLTFGNFDGVHRGHRHIFSEVVCLAQEKGLASAVLTFSPHTAVFLRNRKHFLLLDFDSKARLIEQCGIDYLCVVEFDEECAKMPPEAFIADILVNRCNAKYIVVGEDCVFGHRCKGDLDMLRFYAPHYGYGVEEISPLLASNGDICSSSCVRTYVERGDVKSASQMLGRNHVVSGLVVKGLARGRSIGFPTINLTLEHLVLPRRGVYSARVSFDKERQRCLAGIVNIGVRPTFSPEKHTVLEMHIFDFDEDLYGTRVTVELIDFIRDEKKFQNVEQLIVQIKKDIETVKGLFQF